MRKILSSNGYDLICSTYDWKIISAKMNESYQTILTGQKQTFNNMAEVAAK